MNDNQNTIKIRTEDHEELKSLSKKEDRPMTSIISKAIKLYKDFTGKKK